MPTPTENTTTRLREILAEQFGPERAAALKNDEAPWHEAIGAKATDQIDFCLFVEQEFSFTPHAYFFDDKSLAQIADAIVGAQAAFPGE